jgi:hypothetical protein
MDERMIPFLATFIHILLHYYIYEKTHTDRGMHTDLLHRFAQGKAGDASVKIAISKV